MPDLKKIIKSFDQQKKLNPKIWNKDDEMIKKVRDRLIQIANEFVDFIDLDIVVSDIIMTGSLANYNWSEYSDVDLHLMVDFSQFSKPILPLYEDLFKLKKTIFNDKHDITIYGYEVELYVQNESESHFSSGIYSVLNDEWINKPKKQSITIDKTLIENKVQQWMKTIDNLLDNLEDEPIEIVNQYIKQVKDKLKKYRSSGLEKGGENSDENLVFKSLRRNGYIQKLFDFENKLIDKKLSLKEATTNIGGTFKTDLENGPKNHGKRAFGNWQSDNAWDIFSPPGTVVNSYTDGVVEKIRNTGKNSGKVFGTQVSIKGKGEFPNIFYTHLKNVKLNDGDEVRIGDYIGEISEWVGHEGMEHVHIGLPRGRHLKELLVNSDKIFSGDRDSESITPENITPDESVEEIINKLVEELGVSDFDVQESLSKASESNFLSKLLNASQSGKEFKNLKSPGSKIPYDEHVVTIQTALQYLGFSLPKWGVDGLFGPETESAVKSFQKSIKKSETGVLNDEDLKYLYSMLVIKGFKDSDLVSIQKKSDFSQINVGDDKQFYEEILKGIGATSTEGNLKFLYAWRQAEGGKATNNPFNTTFSLKKDTGMTNYNNVGVKNYSTPQYGLEATVKTLLSGRYSCIVDGLKNDLGAEEISKCSSLKTWGTGDLVSKVINLGKINPPAIYS
jgi:peptidoglycan hydrolase-like protein with peptidoglycan-binding domain